MDSKPLNVPTNPSSLKIGEIGQVSGPARGPRGERLMSRLTVPVGDRDHVQGDPHAPVTLVEYGDYECPHCGRAYPIVKRVQERLGTRLRFVFRNFPLNEVHPHALHAAETAESVAVHGGESAFWAMHDLIFEHQRSLSDAALV
jgi:protein-disulfide isomerase